jgi:hypothetical protein
MLKKMVIIHLYFFVILVQVSKGEIKTSGLIQTWFSATTSASGNVNNGFTVRRARLKIKGQENESISWACQYAWDKQILRLIDAYLEFNLGRTQKVRIGQFPIPGTKEGGLTSSKSLDFVERAGIVRHWGQSTSLNSFRSAGVQLHGNIFSSKLYYATMIANYDGRKLFSPSLSNINSFGNGLISSSRLQYNFSEPIEAGLFFLAGKNDSLAKKSYGMHLYYTNDLIIAKTELIAGVNEQDMRYQGLAISFGINAGDIAPMYRFGTYKPEKDNSDNVKRFINHCIGFNYYINKRTNIQINYLIRNEQMLKGFDPARNNLFYIHLNYFFDKRIAI